MQLAYESNTMIIRKQNPKAKLFDKESLVAASTVELVDLQSLIVFIGRVFSNT